MSCDNYVFFSPLVYKVFENTFLSISLYCSYPLINEKLEALRQMCELFHIKFSRASVK